jgi:DNA-3-methyladenine glycosylase II
MATLIRRAGKLDVRPEGDDHFGALVRSIMYQQLAGKAALAIHTRFLGLFAGGLSPTAVLAVPEGAMRSVGVSGAKQAAIMDLARRVSDGTVPLQDADTLGDDELVARLVQVRGIGRWTAEMYLMFELRRLDVWPVDDLGVRQGYGAAWGITPPPTAKELMPLGDRFRHYRSVVARYCWEAMALFRGGTDPSLR